MELDEIPVVLDKIPGHRRNQGRRTLFLRKQTQRHAQPRQQVNAAHLLPGGEFVLVLLVAVPVGIVVAEKGGLQLHLDLLPPRLALAALQRPRKDQKGRHKKDAHEKFSPTRDVAHGLGVDRVHRKEGSNHQLRHDVVFWKHKERGPRDQSRDDPVQHNVGGVEIPGRRKVLFGSLRFLFFFLREFALEVFSQQPVSPEREGGDGPEGLVGLRLLHVGSPVVPLEGLSPGHRAVDHDVLDDAAGVVVDPSTVEGSEVGVDQDGNDAGPEPGVFRYSPSHGYFRSIVCRLSFVVPVWVWMEGSWGRSRSCQWLTQ
mmetsp:Transcript_6766/g.19567  ORF Transcript_6766/g.19567 Transcript_6766/m.19567 type:complete len:314 (-) Transcript_6766:350-1291(-)